MLVALTVLARLRISISTDGIGCLQMRSLDLVSMENKNLSARSMSLDNNCLFWYLCRNPGLSHLNICTSRVFSHSHLGTNPAPSSNWTLRCPCVSPDLGSSVAFGFLYCLDQICTLCQNSTIWFQSSLILINAFM